MKTLGFAILIILAAAPLAFCDSASFHIGVILPRIIGLNYFPDSTTDQSGQEKELTQSLIERQGQMIVLKTYVMK